MPVAVNLVAPPAVPATDAVVIGVLAGTDGPVLAPGAEAVDEALGGRLRAAVAAAGGTGRAEQVLAIPTLGLAPFPVVLATGLGSAPDAEGFRRAVGAALRAALAHPRVHVAIDAPVAALVEGALLGSYTFSAYKSGPAARIRKITVSAPVDRATREQLRWARAVAEAVQTTRDLVNTPPNDLYPQSFADRAVALAGPAGVGTEVLDPRALTRGGYGGLLAVGGGSGRPPRLVRLTYRPARARARVALVGKGITFDSGGLNLKSANLTWMKSDMAGGAAVIAATVAAATLRLPIEVTATVPMAENMPSGSAYRPSDVVRLRSGRTVEVADTDAEGRLVLADGISRALEDAPDLLVELSTLTGAQLVALGPRMIGAMGAEELREQVTAAGRRAGESIWPMPLPEELRAGLDSPVADLVNVPADRWAGMLVGGRFLAEFMPPHLPWVHLDVAGPAFNTAGPRDYTPKGGTGAGVRTLLELMRELAAR